MFSLLVPRALLLLLFIPFFFWLESRFRVWQNRSQTVFAESQFHGLLHFRNAPGRAAKLFLWLCAWSALVLALARPVWISPAPASGAGKDFSLYLILDASLSMQAEDVLPTRLRAAKRFFLQLARALPDVPLGLIVFEGEAQLACPPTRDHWALGQALENVRVHSLARKGSELESALNLAGHKIAVRSGHEPVAVVVVSDGEMNQPGDPAAAGERLAAQKIPVFCFGVGTAAGAWIPMGADFWGNPVYRLHEGVRVITRLKPAPLQRLALIGRGTYENLQSGSEIQIRHLVAELQKHPWLVSTPSRPTALKPEKAAGRELYQWGIFLAALALALRGAAGLVREKSVP